MCSTSVPFSHSSTRARTMAAGLGMNSAGNRPALEAACQAAISTTNTSHGSRRRGTGLKPPPRNGTARRLVGSDITIPVSRFQRGVALKVPPPSERRV